MRGEFVPGLSALDSPAQIIAWAILFGYAQQLFTGSSTSRRRASSRRSASRTVPASTATADPVQVVTGAPQPSA